MYNVSPLLHQAFRYLESKEKVHIANPSQQDAVVHQDVYNPIKLSYLIHCLVYPMEGEMIQAYFHITKFAFQRRSSQQMPLKLQPYHQRNKPFLRLCLVNEPMP